MAISTPSAAVWLMAFSCPVTSSRKAAFCCFGTAYSRANAIRESAVTYGTISLSSSDGENIYTPIFCYSTLKEVTVVETDMERALCHRKKHTHRASCEATHTFLRHRQRAGRIPTTAKYKSEPVSLERCTPASKKAFVHLTKRWMLSCAAQPSVSFHLTSCVDNRARCPLPAQSQEAVQL